MCNYSEYLKEEQKLKDKLEVLERMEAHRCNDRLIMELLGIDIVQLKSLREKLQEMRTAVMAE